jgi:hypothetical protein
MNVVPVRPSVRFAKNEGLRWPRLVRRGFSLGLVVLVLLLDQYIMQGCERAAYSRWWAGTPIGIFNVGACSFGELFEKKGTLESHLLNRPLHADDALAGGIIGFFYFIHALLKLDAFSAVGFLNRRREGRWDCSWWSD